ncbi:MAG: hypothetical protein HQ522_09250 [Bacteroidetes bacterium]|nr:hypothetical protein [Bacteroidota bacterium]
MKKLKEINLNTFQLNVLLNEQEKEAFEMLLNEGVYCMQCNDVCKDGVVDYSIKLNSLNDVVVDGDCGTCGNKVGRVMEFGEDPTFFAKAVEFRKSIQN